MKSPARGGLTAAPQFLIFNDGCVELSWKWGVPKQYLKWEVVLDQPLEAENPRLINFFVISTKEFLNFSKVLLFQPSRPATKSNVGVLCSMYSKKVHKPRKLRK